MARSAIQRCWIWFLRICWACRKTSNSLKNSRFPLPDQILFAIAYQVPAILLGMILNRAVASARIRAFLFLPGTIVHEGLHWVAAFLLNGQPASFSIWPKRLENGNWLLGTVGVKNLTWYNGIFIGLAPVVSFAFLLLLAPQYSDWNFSQRDLWYWVCTSPILLFCLPSWQDLKVIAKSLLPVIFLVIAAGAIYWLLMQIRFSWLLKTGLSLNVFDFFNDRLNQIRY